MSVLIKGMEMPQRCDECKFFAWKRVIGQYCAVDDRITFHATIDGMDVVYEHNGKCPLVEIPTPHGRLIDADAYEHLLQGLGNRDYRREKGTIQDAIKFLQEYYTPTVIESEE